MAGGAGITPGRLALGLAVAAAAGGLVLGLAADAARERSAHEAFERAALVEVRALADTLERAGSGGEAARAALARWDLAAGPLGALRFVRLDERTLEFSTVPGDAATGPLPRRLARDEKALFDLGEQLRAAVETNRDEGRAREDEVAVAPLEGGRWSVAAPVELAGRVVGLVAAETRPAPAPPRDALPAVFLDLAKPVLPLLVLLVVARRSPRLGRPRALLALAGALVLGLGLWLAQQRSTHRLGAARAAAQEALGRDLAGVASRVEDALAAAGVALAAPLAPSAWDGDRFRAPRLALTDDGGVRAEAATAELARLERGALRLLAAAALLALGLYLFFGLGAGAALWAILVRHRVAYAYALPALVGMLVLVFFPFFYGIALSFTNANIYNTDKPVPEIWIGVQNYREILGDFALFKDVESGRTIDYKNFYWTLGFNIVWTISNVAIGVSLGLALALMLNTKGLRGKTVYRVLLILPWAVPNYITALIWKGMFHQQFGVINQFVQMFGGQPVSWFEQPLTSFATVLATNSWLSFPFMMVISLGALQSIPADLYEAARVDGASRWQQFRSITLPSLKPSLVPAIILSVIWTFNMFNIIYLVSQGEPGGSTEILITEAYKIAFEQYRYGYAAAYSTVIFAILLVYGVWQNRITRAAEGI
jgi:arabinogalactan oligomer/maltooligosaccharide transport system permease protein